MTDALDTYLPPQCGHEGCDLLGPFTTEDGPRCFEHAKGTGTFPIEHAAEAVVQQAESTGKVKRRRRPPDVPPDDMNDVAARALAALVLQATADALTTDTAKMERAILQLADDLPSPLEVAAGILFATTALAGTAGLTDQEVFVIGSAFEDQAAEESQDQTDEGEPIATDDANERGNDEQDGS